MSEQLPIDPNDIQIDKTELSSCEFRLAISLPARHAKRFHKKLKKSGQNASPDETTRQLQRFCIEHGLKRFDLAPIWGATPTPESSAPRYREGDDFNLSIDVDGAPEVDWPDFSTIKIIRPVQDITDEMIDAEMVEQQRDAGKKSPLESQVQVGDEVICNVTLSELGSDAPLYVQEEVTIRIPSASGTASIFEIPVNDIAAKLLECSVGETVSVETVVPDEYNDPTLRNTTVKIELTVMEAFRIEPVTVEAVIEQYGSPNETILRQQIKTALDGKAKQDQQAVIKQQVMTQLFDKIEIPLPAWILATFQDSIAATVRQAMEQRGCTEIAIDQRLEEQNDQIGKVAFELAKKRAISNLLARHLELQVDETSIIAEIGEMAAMQGRRPEDLRKEIMDAGTLTNVAMTVLEKKSIGNILDQIEITDMPADEWIEHRNATA